jgi:diguanylate cyclase (GGDEF)-like protein
MTPLPRSQRHATARPSGRTRASDAPQHRLPLIPSQKDGSSPTGALQFALAITTAVSEAELTACTVEAAGRLTGATVACALDSSGAGYTWGESVLATVLLDAVRVTYPVQRRAFAHLGLPAAAGTADGGSPLVVAANEPDRFGPEADQLLALVAAHAAAGRERLRELAVLGRLADRDPLTGLRHYRPFEERLATSMPDRTAVVAIDIDNFKQINDVYGHQAGDDALVALVGALGRALRGDDHIYRIGGDEFAVVVDVAGPAEVGGITRRLLFAARAAGYPISVGAALRRPTESGRETLLRADRALYQAKREGRNTARLAA